ncbi:hypothetical protein MHAS_03743 [Mycolicibacterium hassiacum DSM 44199]|jgi:hypothetical protein|uniref:hypothetical protein n=1 Tax=Mycolicibacterium hassiacum TaxID=46351 RepID=UPI0003713097|nr:hypothetical protein [Mycolicibacterium hassiacum]MDA4086562.1 hypothetical protein [Mycolicibacterium hassiacum DSM 44199]VCT92019.1 hypothetical protein MHAS_03743 [Mycolicibacterium hassiacum DSM 44199]
MISRWFVRLVGVAVCVVAALSLAGFSGCHRSNRLTFYKPSLPPVFGARVTDGKLQLWTGTPCERVHHVTILFSPFTGDRLQLETPPDRATTVEYLTLGGPYPGGLTVTEALREDFDWRTKEKILLSVEPTEGAGSDQIELATIIAESPDHPEDTYYFPGFGWLNREQVAEQNRKTLLTMCTKDPVLEPGIPETFGARVTDGKLRIWTVTPCTESNGYSLRFRPPDPTYRDIWYEVWNSQDSPPVEIEHLTFGEEPEGMSTRRPLPDGFDWRTMQSVELGIHRPAYHREGVVDVAEVLAGSASHADDTYYFQGVGWLTPDEARDQEGRTFLSPCRR